MTANRKTDVAVVGAGPTGIVVALELAEHGHRVVLVESGEGVENTIWHTYGIIARYIPSVAATMRAARQSK